MASNDLVLPGPAAGPWPRGKVGYVAVVGRPNVGKSTLLNRLLGDHLFAVSPQPQTTRRHWLGILSEDQSQVIFVDTPGAHEGKTELNRAMLSTVDQALGDADVVLALADATRPPGEEDELAARRVAAAAKPTVLAINKVEIAERAAIERCREFFVGCLGAQTAVFEISAKEGQNLEPLLAALRERLPDGPFFYPADQATDAIEREVAGELIREAALHLLYQELPHCLAVEVMQWEGDEGKVHLAAMLYVERDSQKAVVLGRGGDMIRQIRIGATSLLEAHLQKRVVLNLHVKVVKDWRNRVDFLRQLGLVRRHGRD